MPHFWPLVSIQAWSLYSQGLKEGWGDEDFIGLERLIPQKMKNFKLKFFIFCEFRFNRGIFPAFSRGFDEMECEVLIEKRRGNIARACEVGKTPHKKDAVLVSFVVFARD